MFLSAHTNEVVLIDCELFSERKSFNGNKSQLIKIIIFFISYNITSGSFFIKKHPV